MRVVDQCVFLGINSGMRELKLSAREIQTLQSASRIAEEMRERLNETDSADDIMLAGVEHGCRELAELGSVNL